MKNQILLITFLMIIIAGCGSSGITPEYTSPLDESGIISAQIPIGVSERFPDGSPAGGTSALGLFSLHIDPANQNASITNLRQTALNDVLEVVDITNFLMLAPCYDCVAIKSITMDSDGHPVLSIGIRHPFGVGDPLKPISGRNRADLHVFNVEGIIISNTEGYTFSGIGEYTAGFTLLNADGYTGYLDASIDQFYPTTATVHPYITHFADYTDGNFNASNPFGFESVTTPPPSGNLVMAMGCAYDYRDYVFDIETEFDFIFAVGCTYAVSAANKAQRFTPEYRIPQHNKKSASEIEFRVTLNDLAGGDPSSQAEIEIHVVDINHGVEVGSGLDQMLADSSVGNITVDVPGVMSNPLVINGSTPVSGSGHSPSDPLIYTGTIQNTSGADMGIYPGLIKVADTYMPGNNTAPLLNQMDGIKRVSPIENPLEGLFPIGEFATYQFFTIEVSAGGGRPVCDLQVSDTEVGQGGMITADPGTSHDPDGEIISYEYDSDYNGVNFTADIIQTNSDPDFGDPVYISMPCNPSGSNIIVTVAMRVCDDSDPSLCSICTQDITVTTKLGNVGDVSVTAINRGENGANAQLITSVDLDWEDNPCGVAEYAIERGDGWNGDGWTVIDTTTTSDYKFEPSGNDWDDDIRLRVISRAVIGGDPLSDSGPSEEVFMLFVSNAGYQVPGNEWVIVTEQDYQWYWTLTGWYGGGPNVDGWKGTNTMHIGYGPVCHDDYGVTFRWSFVRTPYPIPDLVGQKEAFCDGYYQLFTNGWPSDGSMGLCFGTVSEPNPSIYSETLYDFEPANEIYGLGTPYTVPNVEGLNHEFGETNQGGYNSLVPAPLWWGRIGFYLNDLLEEDRDYVAIGLAIGSNPVPYDQCAVGWNDGFIYIVH